MSAGRLFDYANPGSVVSRLRRRRIYVLRRMILRVPDCRILDVGGEASYWTNNLGLDWLRRHRVRVTLLNHTAEYVGDDLDPDVFAVVIADGCRLPYLTNAFDLVHSNSVIEHVGDHARQAAFAKEVWRVGRWFYLQTPARCFPLEPHTRFPWFQYLPSAARVWLLCHVRLGTYPRVDAARAREIDAELRLLSARQVRCLFPTAVIRRERLFGLTKSYMATSR